MNSIGRMKHLNLAAFTVVSAVLLMGSGCSTSQETQKFAVKSADNPAQSHLRIGDQVLIRFDTGGSQATPPQPVDTVIDEKGEISLALVGRLKAVGMTPSELSTQIQSLYVPKYYVQCNVTVLTSERFFYVGGEVKGTGRYPWAEDITLLKAINMAGSFTDYANRRAVELTRGTQKIIVDAEDARRNPAKDIVLLPGDTIWVSRSIW